jgi:hypothetical protein
MRQGKSFPRKGLSSVADVLIALGRNYPGFSRRMQEISALSHWDQAVGPAIAKHSRALKIEAGVLWVEVDHPTWKAELHYRRQQILEKLQSLERAGGGTPSITELLLMERRQEKTGAARFGTAKATKAPKKEASAPLPRPARPGSPKPR